VVREGLAGFEARLGVSFSDKSLLEASMTHRSYAYEREGGLGHNERLEFLGDAVLGLVVTDLIYRWYPDLAEGEMAKLRASTVNTAVLADAARVLDLGSDLLLGKGEELSGGRDKSSILADAFEAVIGAVYLDRGVEATREFIERSFADLIRDHVSRGVVRDFKTNLQELAAKKGEGTPEYKITASGPDHAKRFRARVFLAGTMRGRGEGRSKKEAEQAAAKEAVAQLAGEA
jgi:ribonuclease III